MYHCALLKQAFVDSGGGAVKIYHTKRRLVQVAGRKEQRGGGERGLTLTNA